MQKTKNFMYTLVLVLLAGVATSVAHADSVTYNFSYNGVGGGIASGLGQFTYDTMTEDLTAFSFTDTITPFFGKSSTFSYTKNDVNYVGMLLFNNGTLLGIDITTNFVKAMTGSGMADFSLNYGFGANLDLTAGTKAGLDTVGTGSLKLVSDIPSASPTPEPSSLMLLGTGILGVAGAARRKFRV